ncbi:MAG: ATP-binding protein [Candidatus Azobacteroides sp.]|nr:ATP-binding protein [Candidatus Azobacteroides sp.]
MKLILSVAIFISSLALYAEPLCNFHHYSGEDGLSETTVTSMLQDHQGFMWFGTWDGLNKFDGYRFKTYKSRPGDRNGLISNRITNIQEDAFGFIWILTYDGLVHRFNPRTEKFLIIPQFNNQYISFKSQIKKVIMVNNRKEVWLLTDDGGCFSIDTNPEDFALTVEYYSKENGKLPSNKVNYVYLDENRNRWLLTNNGLSCLSREDEKCNILLSNSSGLSQDKHARPVFSIIEKEGMLYFGSSEGRVWKYNTRDGSFDLIRLPAETNIISIERILADKLIFISSDSGFFVYNVKTAAIETFNREKNPVLQCQEFTSSYVDRMGEVWLEPNCDGVAHFDPKTNKVSYFKMKIDQTSPYTLLPNFFIFEDVNNMLWVHPRGGGFSYYDRDKKNLAYFYNEPGTNSRRFSNLMHSAYSDTQGNLWMCTYSSELEKISFIQENFSKIKPQPHLDAFSVNEVREIFEDDERFLWVATKDGTLHIFDSKRNKLGILTKTGKIAKEGEKFDGMVYVIMQDKNRNLWFGTKGSGLFKVKKVKTETGFECTLENYRSNPENIYSLSNDNIYSLFEDSSGRIWIATYEGGINLLVNKNGTEVFYNGRNYFKNYPVNEFQRVRYITIDSFGNGWLGTTDGLLVFDSTQENLENTVFHRYNRIPGDKKSLGGNDVHYILCTKEYTYIATFGGGLNITPSKKIDGNRNQIEFEVYTARNGLVNDIILGLLEDNDGNIWMNTRTSISKFNTKSKTFENFNTSSGFISSYFSEAALLKSYTGELMFGADNGFYVFYPQKMKKSNYVPTIVFSNFQLFGKDVYVDEENSPLKVDINDAEDVTLTHKQNVFSIEFAALDFKGPQHIEYAYKLEGFDNSWNYSNKNRHISYTNLPHGKYVFRVRSTNNEGVWVNNERSLPITILPSFWETPWAVLLYIVIGLLIFALAVYILFTFYKLKNKVSIEQKMTHMKLRFFTDISHELRTPLTLIAAPVEHILEKEELNENVKQHLKTVQKNTSRMLRLINQILDFRKIQNKKMKLHVEEIPIGTYINSVCENFTQIAREHQIDFSIIDKTEGTTIWADKDKVEKIIFNILSNAFKFTPKGKSIQVIMEKEENDISIKIKDHGHGMSKDKLKNIFERFTSSENSIESF